MTKTIFYEDQTCGEFTIELYDTTVKINKPRNTRVSITVEPSSDCEPAPEEERLGEHMSKFCTFCETTHTSSSCYHPGRTRLKSLEAENLGLKRELRAYSENRAVEHEAIRQTIESAIDAARKEQLNIFEFLRSENERLYALLRKVLAEYYLVDKPFCGDRMRDVIENEGIYLKGYERNVNRAVIEPDDKKGLK